MRRQERYEYSLYKATVTKSKAIDSEDNEDMQIESAS